VARNSPRNLRNPRFGTAASETSQAALLPSMDHLHGDVVDDEVEAACYYEYARESPDFCELASFWAGNKDSYKEMRSSLIWQCPSFPQKSWNQLSQGERAKILEAFQPSRIQPLEIMDVLLLSLNGVFDQLKRMEAEVINNKMAGKQSPKVYPIIEDSRFAWVHVLFTLDFRKSRKRLLREFDNWLQLPGNRARFDACGQNLTGKTGTFKDRLKDLAAWRLYRELGCQEALAFVEKNRKRDRRGRPRQFHDARKEQSKANMPLNEAPLYSQYNEESAFLKARARALAHGKELIPSQTQWLSLFAWAEKKNRKISKSSS
jgi:hypothetical protein